MHCEQDQVQFLVKEVQFLGHRLNRGVTPIQSKVDAIMKAPEPSGVAELKSFLGMVSFLCKVHTQYVIRITPTVLPVTYHL